MHQYKSIHKLQNDRKAQSFQNKQERITQKNNTIVRFFSGATTQYMQDYLKPIMKKSSNSVIFHIRNKKGPNKCLRKILYVTFSFQGFTKIDYPTIKLSTMGTGKEKA